MARDSDFVNKFIIEQSVRCVHAGDMMVRDRYVTSNRGLTVGEIYHIIGIYGKGHDTKLQVLGLSIKLDDPVTAYAVRFEPVMESMPPEELESFL
jgi:hypothetical protein